MLIERSNKARKVAMEEEEWVVIRSKLREVWLEHPEWSHHEMADELGCSKSWVKNWIKRIRSAPLESQEVFRGKSRTPKHPPPPMDPRIVEKILEIRDHPPQQLGRIPGPATILYYLNIDPELKEAGCKLPRSIRTIWKVFRKNHRIYHPLQGIAEPGERPQPGVEWGVDFHDVTTVPADPDGKQQHMVEILNRVGSGG
jgi:hypothetical protein